MSTEDGRPVVRTRPSPVASESWTRVVAGGRSQTDEVGLWHADLDSEQRPLDGRYTYLLHFDRSQEPPARGFWSISLYDQRSLPVDNRLHRFSIGDRNDLAFNVDGSLDIVVRHESAALRHEPNWLPAPAAHFFLVLQIYWPLPAALNGIWTPPPITRLGRPTTPAL